MRSSDPFDRAPLFALVEPEHQPELARRLTRRAIPEGRLLFQSGDPADALFVVESGRFRLFERNRANQEHVFAFVGPGEVLGEEAFIAETDHVQNALAVEPSRVWVVTRPEFDELIAPEQIAMRYLASIIAQRQTQANQRLAEESAPDDQRGESGFVTAFYSPRGGAGVTTLAQALGITLAEQEPEHVALLDLDVLFGHALYNLWLEPRAALSDVSPTVLPALDRTNLDYYLHTHASSLRVVTAARNPAEGERVTGELVRVAIGTLRRHFSHVVLDLPHSFSDIALSGLEAADQVVLVATPELTTLRDVLECRRIFTEVLHLPAERLRWVLNHPLPYGGVPVSDFAAATGVPWEEVPHGGDAPSQAAMHGEALVSSRRGHPISRFASRFAMLTTRAQREALALGHR